MSEIYELPIFGIFVTIFIFYLAQRLRLKFNYLLLNPVLIATASIILLLLLFDINFEQYNRGGEYLSFFLGPSIVALGVLFYEKYKEIRSNLLPFLFAVAVGGTISIVSVTFIAIFLNTPEILIKSIVSKSVTTPIAIEITKITGGIPSITAGVVIAVGIFGNAFGPAILRFWKITSKSAIGTALGTAAHGIGTARALEDGKLTGVYSGMAMCINGILTAAITPYFVIWILKVSNN